MTTQRIEAREKWDVLVVYEIPESGEAEAREAVETGLSKCAEHEVINRDVIKIISVESIQVH